MLRIENLTVHYGQALALEDVCVIVRDRELTAIIGPNGAGKTTLLKAISRLVNPTSGSILFDGELLLKHKPHQLSRLGIAHCPEGRRPFPEMSVMDNLMIGGYVLARDKLQKRLCVVFELFPILKERKSQEAATLSGGEQQMLAIARALMAEPTLLLIDEPSLGLSPLMVNEIERIVHGIKESGVSVVMVEGNFDVVRDLADIVYVFDHGHSVFSGTVSEIANDLDLSRAYIGM